ncbi:DUF397 domain-containing protein [Streptomyces sp. NPDC006704]|uniref:DUF397 domain-containing protein n=1 Tax=Streptomyces sp. NPDC006704 TaxID=3364760 RepID=UPI0036962A6B
MSNRTTFEFHKSSYSGGQGECVEVASNVSSVTAVRDSKTPTGPVLILPDAAWSAFVASVTADSRS